MDLDDDSHLCLRCGKTVEGLDNYVSHRQQLCYKFQRPSCSPFLSDASKNLSTSAENDFPYDISKVSASDFFLSLSLQSNFKTVNPCTNLSCDVQKNVDDGFCSRLEIPVEDGELMNGFSPDKQLCSDRIIDEQNCLDINNVGLDDDKWDCFKTQNDLCSSVCYSKDTVTTNSTENLSLEQKQSAEVLATSDVKNKVKRSKKKMLKQYNFSQFSIMNNYKRTSYRQKMNANGSLMCCQGKQKILKCNLCNKMFPFARTFIDHLLNCPKKISDNEKWRDEVFRNESLLIRSLHFTCLLCSFFCGDSFEFLEHLRSSNHRQNAAYLKNPLICLPCRDECSASDEIKEHFSKTHLQYNKGDHPVIVAEKKKNVHCCYCLTLVRSSSHLEVGNNVNVSIDKDVNFLKNSFPIVSGCAYGVDKSMVNSYTTKVSSLISACEAESPNVTETKCCDKPEELHITSVLSEEPLKIKISKSVLLKGDQNPNKLKENIIGLEEVPTENTLPPLIGKITTQNGKFIYTKLNSNKVLLCVLCGSKHVSKASLKRHMEKCDLDDKASQKSFYLKQKYKKLKKKSVKNQYLCDRCPYIGKSFNQLTRHSRSHSGEKPFKCLDCEYTFALSSQLIRHKRLHTGQKPYNCPYCKYTCNTQENLRKHILKTKKHKGKMMYPCQYCSYESNEFSTFRDHLLEDHSKQFPKGVKSLSSSVHELSLSYKN